MASAQESNNQMAIGGLRRPTEKIAARQLTDCTGQKKNCGAAINGLRQPKEQNSGVAIRVLRLPLQNLQRGNQGIAPAKRKIAAWQLKDCAG
jgi:hypothetical protein